MLMLSVNEESMVFLVAHVLFVLLLQFQTAIWHTGDKITKSFQSTLQELRVPLH
jgi:hypothetical protein